MRKEKRKSEKKVRTVYKSTLFKRYFFLMVVIILLCLLSLGLSMLLLVTNYWWNEKFDILNDNSRSISALAVEKGVFDGKKDGALQSIGESLALFSNAAKSEFFILDADGRILACPESGNDGCLCEEHRSIALKDTPSHDELTDALHNGFTSYTDLAGSLDHACFVVATPITVSDKNAGIVIASEDALIGLLPYIKSITKMFLFSALIAFIIAFISSYVFSYGVAKPLTEMTDITKLFAKGDFRTQVREQHKKGEMKLLAQSLNKMAADLEAEDAAKKSFVANVSHELKTPMTTIGGFIDGILDGTIPEEKEREYLSTVSTEVKRLSRLVVAMLNLSKIESGETKLIRAEYDLLPQVFETMLSFEPVIEKNGISVEGFESLEGIRIFADRDLLHQVVYNLVDNAVKFTPNGGTITLSAQSDPHKTRFAIRNSGAGVEKEEIQHIFERFYKVDKSRSYDVKGVGLGLYIVKTILSMHGGTIEADSRPGEYTEFSFTVPCKQDHGLQ